MHFKLSERHARSHTRVAHQTSPSPPSQNGTTFTVPPTTTHPVLSSSKGSNAYRNRSSAFTSLVISQARDWGLSSFVNSIAAVILIIAWKLKDYSNNFNDDNHDAALVTSLFLWLKCLVIFENRTGITRFRNAFLLLRNKWIPRQHVTLCSSSAIGRVDYTSSLTWTG